MFTGELHRQTHGSSQAHAPMTRPRFEAVIAQTLAAIRSGHTKLNGGRRI
jgi:hypothetical protein